jgi:formylglycine-generating enzyme required for sulfatase activity
MTGNVYEWCHDWDDYYGAEAEIDPTGPSSGIFRIFRGGGFNSGPFLIDGGLENSTRRSWDPEWIDFDIGFRIARRP